MSEFLGKFDCSTGVVQELYRAGDIAVRTSTIMDMLLVDKLQKENSHAVGFIQKTIWEQYVWGGQRNFVVLIAEANNDAVGYVLITPGKRAYAYAKIQQIAVRNDARRLQYGTALISVCRDFCKEFGRKGFTLRCRQDLESNRFWKAIGFTQYGTWQKGVINHVGMKASNDINLWKIDLNESLPGLFAESDFALLEIGLT
jgi:predicted GNAT family N-acyltransferase